MKICFNCNEKFSNFVEIDGTVRNLCNRKYCLKCSPFKKHNTRQIHKITENKLKQVCLSCKKNIPNKHGKYLKYQQYCSSCGNIKRGIDNKKDWISYKGGSCTLCGYNKCYASMVFHHLDPLIKDFNLSTKRYSNFDKVKEELDKCILLCHNCHYEVHAGFSKI